MKNEPNDIVELRKRVAKANELSKFNRQIGFDNRGNHVLGAFLTGVLQEYDTLRAERDEWKHRAEKAERRVFEERTNRAFAVRAIEAERDELQLQVGDWKDVAEQFRDALVERGKVLGFFASVIKSGEPWTPQCDEMLRATFVHKDIVPAVQPSTDTWEDTRARCS